MIAVAVSNARDLIELSTMKESSLLNQKQLRGHPRIAWGVEKTL